MYSVLYVDDEPALLELGKLFLEKQGDFKVDTESSSQRALVTLEKQKYDVIISDYEMPGTNGLSFLKQLRAQKNDTPFILFTGRGRDEIIVEAINNGADFYTQKGGEPVAQFAELALKIRQGARRREAEIALEESRDYLHQIFSSVRAGILVIDAKTHTILDVNPAAAELMKESRENIIGNVCHHFVCPSEMGRCPVTDLGCTVDNSERILVTSDKKNVPIIKYVTSVTLSGKPVLLETFVDYTERKEGQEKLRQAYEELQKDREELQAAYAKLAANERILAENCTILTEREKQLKESEKKYRDLFELNSAVMVILDPVEGTIADANSAACRFYGYTREEIRGMPAAEISGTRPTFSLTKLPPASKDVGVLSLFRHRLKSGEIRTVEVFRAPIEIGGKNLLYSIVMDVTDYKKRLINLVVLGSGAGLVFSFLLSVFGISLFLPLVVLVIAIIVVLVSLDWLNFRYNFLKKK